MPRINDRLLNCVFYLYRSREAAERGEKRGGTGFIVGVLAPSLGDIWYPVAVSCKHVVHTDGFSYIRINTALNETKIIELEPHEWIAHPDGDDIAISVLADDLIPDIGRHETVTFIEERRFISRESLLPPGKSDHRAIGPGDDIFMVGRFINHEGQQRNEPSVRFGNISMLPHEKIRRPDGFLQESFAVEMRSMAGYSGSPVFLYRDPVFVHFWFLGVNWGYITDDWEIARQKRQVMGLSGTLTEREAEFVKANTGMNGVVPAWKLTELLHLPRMEAVYAEKDMKERQKRERDER